MRILSLSAPPKSRTHQPHSEEAMTPKETRVFAVVEPWRPAAKAALWNGYAPQVVMRIEARATVHCYPLNCGGGATGKTRARIAKGVEIRRWCSRLSARSRAPSPIPGEEAVDEGVVSEIVFGEDVVTEHRDDEKGACEFAFRKEGITEYSDGEGVVSETVFGEEVPTELGFVEDAVIEEAFVGGAEVLDVEGAGSVLGMDTVLLLKALWSRTNGLRSARARW